MKLLKNFSKKELADLQKGQKIMTNMLKEFDNICRTNGLKYWCVGGTLIGAVRHKGWIPHDADIDVAMLKSDYEQLQKIIQKKLSKGYWFQDKSTDKYYKSNIGKIRYLYAHYGDYKRKRWHNGLQLDIFVFKGNQDKFLSAPYEGKGDIKSIAKNIIFPLKELYFDDVLVYVPNDYKKYCIDAWGSFPPKELPINKQYPHEGRISFSMPTWMKDKYSNLYYMNKIIIKNLPDSEWNGIYYEKDVKYKDAGSISYVKDNKHHMYHYKGIWRLGENGVKVYKQLGNKIPY